MSAASSGAVFSSDDITARSKACVDAGKEAIQIDQYQLQSDATNAVVTGKDDAMLADSPVIAYAIQQTGDKLEQLGDIYDAAPYGVRPRETRVARWRGCPTRRSRCRDRIQRRRST